jgi:hypothetical protein
MKRILWVLLFFTTINMATAQEVYTSSGKPGYHKKPPKKQGYDPDKLIIGGGISVDFGADYVLAGLSPILGYRITDNFSAGVGVGYLYFKVPDPYYYNPPLESYYDKGHLVYPSLWSRYFVYRNIYLTGTIEYDVIAGKYPEFDVFTNQISTKSRTVTAQSLLFGAGLKQSLGGRVSIFAQIQHEFLQQKYSPYSNNPIIFNAGVCAGL